MLGLCCCAWTFSSCSEQGLLSSCSSWASHCTDFSCCGARAPGHTDFSSCGARLSCSFACGIFWTRDRTCVPFIGTQVLNHWTVRKVPSQALLMRSPVTYLLPNPLILSSPWHSMQPATSSFLKPTLFLYFLDITLSSSSSSRSVHFFPVSSAVSLFSVQLQETQV